MRALVRHLAIALIASLIAPQGASALDPSKLPPITLGTGSAGDGSGVSVPTPSDAAPPNTLANIFAGGTTVPKMNLGSLLFNGFPAISHIPTGNPIISNGSLVLQTFTSAVDTREIGVSLGMSSTTGSAHSGDGTLGNGDKIVLYTGQRAFQGSFNTWSMNPLAQIEPGNTSWRGSWVMEADVNNLAQDVGDAAGPAGLSDKHSWAIQTVSGGSQTSAKRNTAAFSVFSLTQRGVFNRGYLCQSVSARLSCYEDHSSAATSFQDWGNHVVSLDLSNATTSVGAMRLANGMPIVARSAANTSDVPLLYNTAGTTVLGAETNISLPKPTTVYAPFAVNVGTGAASTGQPTATFAATISNATNAPGYGGLFVKSQWGAAGTPVLEVGNDVVNGAYTSFLTVDGGGATTLRKGVFAPGLPTSGGAVKGTACVDTSGQFYVKTTTGACL